MLPIATHRLDHDTGHWHQLVSPGLLRRILTAAGLPLTRPREFGAADQWDAGLDRAEEPEHAQRPQRDQADQPRRPLVLQRHYAPDTDNGP